MKGKINYMKKLAILILISLFLISCSSSDDDVENPENTDYIVYQNASLVINETENGTFMEVEDGDKLVFEYKYSTEGQPEIADDEFTEVVYFELDHNTGDFTLDESDFEATRTYLGRFCFCGNTGFFPVTSGIIEGEKTGDLRWNVTLDVEALIEAENDMPETSFEAKASGIFRPRN